MSSLSPAALRLNPELNSLYRIAVIPQSEKPLQDFFQRVLDILSEYFSIPYSALILQDPQKEYLRVEALFGVGREVHPGGCNGGKGTIGKVLDSRKPMVIHNLGQEPLYEEVSKGTKRIEKIRSPLLCIPLVAEGESMGVINITPLYGGKDEFDEDFLFLTTLSAMVSPTIRTYQLNGECPPPRSGKPRGKLSPLEEVLKERLGEVLNKIDPYVESKARMSLLDDMIALVEKILITSALERVGNVQVAASQLLGINRNTLRKKIKDLKIKCR
jgi:transcriptional regulator with GAF, ATPase, and Fis domain